MIRPQEWIAALAAAVLFAACGPAPTAAQSLEVNPTTVDFGKRPLFQPAHLGLAIHNHGGATVERLNLELVADAASGGNRLGVFGVTPAPSPLAPLDMAAGESLAIVISFNPVQEGQQSATLRIRSGEPADPGIAVLIVGVAENPFTPVDAGNSDPCEFGGCFDAGFVVEVDGGPGFSDAG